MRKLLPFRDFKLGYNDTVDPDMLKDNELTKAENVELAEEGGFTTRNGTSKFNTTSFGANVTDGLEWIIQNQSRKLVVINKKLYWVKDDDTKIEKLILASDYIGYIAIKDKLYIADGSNVYVWGDYDYLSSKGSVSIKTDDIVLNETDKKFYKSKATRSVNLTSENYSNTTYWEDVTDIEGKISNVIRVVKASSETDNDLAPIKKCKMFVIHPESLRIFASGNPEDPKAVYFSEPNIFEYFKKSSVLYPITSEKEVTGIAVLLDSVLVSYNNIWYRYAGIDPTKDAIWKPLPVPYGCVSHESIALTPFSITYLSHAGLMNVNASVLYQDAMIINNTKLITNLAENRFIKTIKSITNPEKARSIFHDDKYILAYCDNGSGVNNKVLVYKWASSGVSIVTGWNVNAWIKSIDNELYFATTNYLFKAFDSTRHNDIDVATGFDKPIILDVETKNYDLNFAFNYKFLFSIYIAFKQFQEDDSFIDISLIADYINVTQHLDISLIDSLVWGRTWGLTWGFIDTFTKKIKFNSKALRYKLRFYNDTLDDPVTVYSIGFDFMELFPGFETVEDEGRLLE